MSFGGQTVTFVTVTEDLDNRDRYGNPALVRTEHPVAGCRFRPLTAEEKVDIGDVVTDPWKATCPPVAAAMNAKSNDEILVDGVTYQVSGGARSYVDMGGTDFKITIICERKAG